MSASHIHGLESVPPSVRGCVLTIGNFDGVHTGHRHILATARALADAEGVPITVLTFDPPPDLVLRPDDTPKRIATPDHRAALLLEAGADWVVTAATTREMLSLAPERFVDEIIMDRFAPTHIVEGDNFFFGAKRAGTVDVLRELGKTRSYVVHVVQAVMIELDGEPCQVSSTLIRSLVSAGRIELANRYLQGRFTLIGPVVSGHARGRTLGYPTANIDTRMQMRPADGIYAGWAEVDDLAVPAAVSIGSQPTFPGGRFAVEAHLLDVEGDWYDKTMAVALLAKLRGQETYPDARQLQAQIAKDVARVREIVRQGI